MIRMPIKNEIVSVLRNYEIRLGSIENYPSFHVLKTDRGVKVLRVWKNIQAIEQAFTSRELLAKSGFRKIDRFIRTKTGEPYVIDQGIGYSLTDVIDGLPPTIGRKMDMEIIGKTLGELHSALAKVKVDNRFELWSSHFERGLEHLSKIEEKIKNRPVKGELDELILKDIPQYKSQIQQSIQMAQKVERNAFKSGEEPRWCHGNLTLNSFKIDEYGEAWLSDFEHLVVDIPAYDLAKLISRVYLKSGSDIQMIQPILSSYDQFIPLETNNKLWILTYIAYPHDIWKFLHLYHGTKVSNQARVKEHYLAIEERQIKLDKLYQGLFTYFNLT